MENKNEYELVELILGTRKLYQGCEKDLKLLKHFCTPTKKNVKKFHFHIYQRDKCSPELYCSYTKNQNVLQKEISKVRDSVAGIALDENIGFCSKDNDGNYLIKGTYGKKFPVEIKSPVSFGKITSEILSSEFVQKIRLKKTNDIGYIRSSDEKAILSFSPCDIRLYEFKESYPNAPLDYSVIYCSETDTILFTSFDEELPIEKIAQALKIKFSANKLDRYHLTSIHSSDILQKPIVFEEKIKPCRFVEYEIKEEEKQVVLAKKRG